MTNSIPVYFVSTQCFILTTKEQLEAAARESAKLVAQFGRIPVDLRSALHKDLLISYSAQEKHYLGLVEDYFS